MRALCLGLAAALCVAALLLQLFDVSKLAAVIALLVGGVFLVLGLKMSADGSRPGSTPDSGRTAEQDLR